MQFILIIVLGIYSFVKFSEFSRRITYLEGQLQQSRKETANTAPAVASQRSYEQVPGVPTPSFTPTAVMETQQQGTEESMYEPTTAFEQRLQSSPPTSPVYTPEAPNPFITWLAKDFLVKVGGLLFILALVWFVSYAFANNWIGPAGRIALGLIVSVVFMVGGVFRIQTVKTQGAAFSVIGAAGVILTLYAARYLYEFFTPETALSVMFMSVVFVTYLGVRYRMASMAIVAFILGAVAPFLINTPDPSVVGLNSYILILVLGSVWVTYVMKIGALQVIAFATVALYGMPYLVGGYGSDGDQSMSLLFAFVFTLIFFVTNIASMLHSTGEGERQAQAFMAIATGLYIAAWIDRVVATEWQSALYVVWALVFAMGSFVAYRLLAQKTPFYIYGAVAVGMLGIATAAELSGPMLTVAFAFEVSALVFVFGRLLDDTEVAARVALLYSVPILLSLTHLTSSAWQTGWLHADFFAIVVLAFTSAMAGIGFYSTTKQSSDTAMMGGVLGSCSIFYAIALLWLITHAVLTATVATAVSLLLYTIVGIVLYIIGTQKEHNFTRAVAAVLIGGVIARLFMVDVWQMPVAGRIITFCLIGLLLMSTAFLVKHRE